MKILFAAFFLFSNIALAETEEPPCMICTNEKFNQNGIITVDSPNGSKSESGIIGVVTYKINYRFGNATFKHEDGYNWDAACTKDQMTSKVWCSTSRDNLTVLVFDNGKEYVSVGHDHYPRTPSSIKIGSNKPINTDDSDGNFTVIESKKIINSMATEKEIMTRYVEWPYKTWVDKTTDLQGFKEASEFLRWAVKRIK